MRHGSMHGRVLAQLLGILFQIANTVAGGADNRIGIVEVAHQPEGEFLRCINLAAHQELATAAGKLAVVVRHVAQLLKQREHRLHAIRQKQIHVAWNKQIDSIFGT